MRASAPVLGLVLLANAGCSLLLDFDDLEDLPCPCDADHVCLLSANRCVRRASVDLFKSCSTDTQNAGDDLCPQNAICQAVNDQGPRCLPTCAPSSYVTPESGLTVAAACPLFGNTCWPTARGGVCSEGVCTTTPNSCRPPGQCVLFNGAGVCFTPCSIFQSNPDPCAGGQVCHPIGDTNVTACVPAGTLLRTQICSEQEFCSAKDAEQRPMICDRAFNSTAPRRCLPICRPGDGTCFLTNENCVVARPNLDTVTGADLGVCEGS